MSNETELLLNAALRLPAEEREQLAQQIYRSLDDDRPTPAEAQEIERRVREVRSGKVQTVAADEAYEQVLQRVALTPRGEAVTHRFHPEALDEWHEAAAYYVGIRDDLGTEFIEAIRTAIGTVLENPTRWPPFTEHTRAYRLHKFPYRLVYSIEPGETVLIASVMHTSRDSAYVERRLD